MVDVDWVQLGRKVFSRRDAHFDGAKRFEDKAFRPLPGTVGPKRVVIHVVGSVC